MTHDAAGSLKKLWAEIRRRRVIRTTVAYVVVAYLLVEAASIFFPILLLPEWTVRAITAVFILGLPLVVVLAWLFDIEPGKERDNATESSESIAADSRINVPPQSSSALASVAVLPFENQSPEGGTQYIADGVAMELHATLAKVHRLRVAARFSTFSLRAKDIDLKEIGRKLNVQFVISGSVLCVNDRLRITVELDNAVEGVQIWAETYDRKLDDIFSIQHDIAYAVTSEFGGARLRDEVENAARHSTENLDAWSLVQRARSYVVQFTPDALERAVPLLRKAIELDPAYTSAHAALALVLAEAVLNGLSANPDKDAETALQSADSAFSQSPGDPFVLKMCGAVWAYFGMTRKSIGALKLAVEIAPFDFGSWGYMGWPLVATGDSRSLVELQEIMQRIIQSAPHHPGVPYWRYHQSVGYLCADDLGAAARLAALSVDRNPAFPWGWMHFANVMGLSGADAERDNALQRCAEIAPSLTIDHYVGMVGRMSQEKQLVRKRTEGLRAKVK